MTLLLALAGCGGDGSRGSTQPEHAAIRTLAYVDTVCHEDAKGFSASQRLQVVRGDAAPVTVAEIPTFGRLPAFGLCPLFGAVGTGVASVFALAFQRLGVSPNGSGVVFEVNFAFSLFTTLGVRNPLTPEQEGVFFVRADGSDLRKLGPPSREPAQLLGRIPTPTMGAIFWLNYSLPFSPDGRFITFADRGPGPADEDAAQLVILDLASGKRTPVTQMPDVPPPDASNLGAPFAPAISYYGFKDDATILFFSRANPKGLNPEGDWLFFTVKTDGTELTALPPLDVLPGGIVPVLSITNPVTQVGVTPLGGVPGTPVNPSPLFPPDSFANTISEIFVISPDHVLQLTNFRRIDTGAAGAYSDGQRVFFIASANPFGTNPSENSQIFSIDTLGADLRQLTHFQPGCSILSGPFLDPETRTLVFGSTCDDLGMNPNGEQIFVMRSDGTGLRQLTATRGAVTAADGSVDVELPGPIAYQTLF